MCHPRTPVQQGPVAVGAYYLSRSMVTIGIVVPLLLGACAPKSSAWVQAKTGDTPEAYRRFVRAEPSAKQVPTALERMEKLDWDQAERENSSRAWGAYLSYHTTSARKAEAEARLEEARWAEAVAENTKARYQVFATNHPDSPHAAEAFAKLDDLEYEEAKRADTSASYGLYLDRHFEGAHAEDARKLYEDRIWQTTLSADTREAYASFLERFPEGRYASHCKELLEGYQFSGLAIQVVIRDQLRADSPAALEKVFKKPLEKALQAEKIPFVWMKPIDARNRPDLDPLQGLELPKGYGVMVIEIRETLGRAFAPRGNATDIRATVQLIPIRLAPMKTVEVKASTRSRVTAPGLEGLHTDAQLDFAEKLAVVPIGWAAWYVEGEKPK